MLSKSAAFWDFQLSHGSVATYCRWGGHLCNVCIENFLRITWWKNFENLSIFFKVIIKHQMAYFLGHNACTIMYENNITLWSLVKSYISVGGCRNCVKYVDVNESIPISYLSHWFHKYYTFEFPTFAVLGEGTGRMDGQTM